MIPDRIAVHVDIDDQGQEQKEYDHTQVPAVTLQSLPAAGISFFSLVRQKKENFELWILKFDF